MAEGPLREVAERLLWVPRDLPLDSLQRPFGQRDGARVVRLGDLQVQQVAAKVGLRDPAKLARTRTCVSQNNDCVVPIDPRFAVHAAAEGAVVLVFEQQQHGLHLCVSDDPVAHVVADLGEVEVRLGGDVASAVEVAEGFAQAGAARLDGGRCEALRSQRGDVAVQGVRVDLLQRRLSAEEVYCSSHVGADGASDAAVPPVALVDQL